VKSSRIENASAVVCAGLRTLEREERPYEEKLRTLRATIAEGDVFAQVLEALQRMRPRKHQRPER
jgi:Arc/MetJ-type ribon-helix-helix transcriptional regulator